MCSADERLDAVGHPLASVFPPAISPILFLFAMDDIASYTATAEELLAATDVVNAACARAQLQRPRASAEQIVMHVAVQQEVARVRERARAHDELEQAEVTEWRMGWGGTSRKKGRRVRQSGRIFGTSP